MITAVNAEIGCQGQSVIEFTLLASIFIVFLMIMIKVNIAMQAGIVNQQYSRAQILFLAFNHPFYPEAKYQTSQINYQMNQMVIGVSKKSFADGNTQPPDAQIEGIVRSKIDVGSNEAQKEPDARGFVRIRNTITLCTQTYWLGNLPMKSMGGPPQFLVASYNINNSTNFSYICGSKYQYE